MLTGTVNLFAVPVDSIMPPIEEELQEVIINAQGSRKFIGLKDDGSFLINGKFTSEMPSFLGGGDLISTVRSLPSIVTANDLQALMSVRGGSPGSTLFESDGARIINPLHMLGLYSAFNPSFYKSYTFRESRNPAVENNSDGSALYAFSGNEPDTCLNGEVIAGLLESHGALRIPIRKGKSSLVLGARQSYLNLLFPNILKLGESLVKYNFTDCNVSYKDQISDHDLLDLSIFFNRDALTLHSDKSGTKDGDFGWRNLAGNIKWYHNNLTSLLSVSNLSNKFTLNEGSWNISLPSSFTQISAKTLYHLNDFNFEFDLNYRHSSMQKNEYDKIIIEDNQPNRGLELNLGGSWNKRIKNKIQISAGLRFTFYHCNNYNSFYPMPRFSVTWLPIEVLSLYLACGRYVRFDRQIMESNAGLPTDFWINAHNAIKPEDVNSLEFGINGRIPVIAVDYGFTLYGKLIYNIGEFTGTILNFVNAGYNPLNDYITGKGKVFGASVYISRQVGKIRFRGGYAYTVSRGYFEKYDNQPVPTSTDRPHDLNLNLSYSPVKSITISLTYIYATGTPYTRARYGYIIGENLIAEYFPHNSSRLPDYKRMDFSATWYFFKKRNMKQSLNLSVYNLLNNHNVLFLFTNFSAEGKISTKSSVMKSVIPSIAYKIEF